MTDTGVENNADDNYIMYWGQRVETERRAVADAAANLSNDDKRPDKDKYGRKLGYHPHRTKVRGEYHAGEAERLF